MINDKQYLECQIKTLERLIKIKKEKGLKIEDMAEEIHDLAVLKNQTNNY